MSYMDLSTNSATTKDWLKASENIRIAAFDPRAVPATGTPTEAGSGPIPVKQGKPEEGRPEK